MKKLFYVLLGFSSLAVFAYGAQPKPKTKVKPNIIYILADDLGYGDLGCYGQKQIKTPAIDKLADDGIRFENHYSGSPVCAPSRCVLMTGLHTGHAKIRGNQPTVELGNDDLTIASVLKKEGYKTAAVGKWGLGEGSGNGTPWKQGFDYFFGYLNQIKAHNHYPEFLHRNDQKIMLGNQVVTANQGYAKDLGTASTTKKVYAQDLFMSEALQFVETNAASPFFLYLSVVIPHANNEHELIKAEHGMEVPDYGIYANKPWPNAQKGLASMISYLDKDVARLREKLEQLGIDKNTIIIFASDNGPHAEGNNDPKFFNSSGDLRGRKRDLYEGGVRVPMIVSWPGTIKPGQVSKHVSAFWDVLPTISDIIGVSKPKKTDGISFLPTLLGRKQKNHKNLYWEFNEQGGKQAVRSGEWKLVKLNIFEPTKTSFELYNIETDRNEQNDLAAKYPKIVSKLKKLLIKQRTDDKNFPLVKS